MSLDRVDLKTQKGSVSDVSGSDVSVSNLDGIEDTLSAIQTTSGASTLLLASSELSTADDKTAQELKQNNELLQLLLLHAEKITGEVFNKRDIDNHG